MKVSSILHPLRAAKTVKAQITLRIQMGRFGAYGRHRFRGDPRYDLQSVTEGFASRLSDECDDTQLLERISTAYRFARARQDESGETLPDPTRRPLHAGLRPSIQALLEGDAVALSRMYRNFYRDPCSSGLMAAPGGMTKAYFDGRIRDVYRRFYLSHVLHRLDYWQQLTEGRYSISNLAGPGVGNPFGVVMNGTHIALGAEYSHYSAHRVSSLIDRAAILRPVIAEIGCGFGAIAYFQLRDRQPLSWIGLDTAERVALSSYYLMKAFPQFRFLLYGEKEITRQTLHQADVVLLPGFALSELPAATVDILFSSHGMSQLAPEDLRASLRTMTAVTRRSMLYIGHPGPSAQIADILAEQPACFLPVNKHFSGWHTRGISGAGVGGAAAASTPSLVEQTFVRQASMNHFVEEGLRSTTAVHAVCL